MKKSSVAVICALFCASFGLMTGCIENAPANVGVKPASCSDEGSCDKGSKTKSSKGDVCPPKGVKGKLAYIRDSSCTPDECDLGDYSDYFEDNVCPKDYPECAESSIDGVFICVERQKDSGDTKDKDSDGKDSDKKTGTDDDPTGTTHQLGRQPNGQLNCKAGDSVVTVNPADEVTCGAMDCDTADFGGSDCSTYWDGRSCQDKDGVYDCRCTNGKHECAGRCFDTSSDRDHCGESCQKCGDVSPDAICQNGQCVVPKCDEGTHPILENGLIKSCEPNTSTACAPTLTRTNDSIMNCELRMDENATGVACSSFGTCIATGCKPEYKLDSTGTMCVRITCGDNEYLDGESCVPYKSSCEEGSHISEDRKSCVPNTNTSCAPVSGWPNASGNYADYVKSCSDKQPYCDRGTCACGENMVLNKEGNACVPKVCAGLPGIETARVSTDSKGNEICVPKTCQADYSLDSRLCLPLCAASCKCPTLMPGYSAGTCMSRNGAPHRCEASKCSSGYQLSGYGCAPVDYCCGSSCINCKAKGLSCSSGTCK